MSSTSADSENRFAVALAVLLLIAIRHAALDLPEFDFPGLAVNVVSGQRNSSRFFLHEKVITVGNNKLMTTIWRLEFSRGLSFVRDLLHDKFPRIFGAELHYFHFAGVFLSSNIIDRSAFR